MDQNTQYQMNSPIDPKDLTEDKYIDFCKMYLTERIHEVIPPTELLYRHVSKLIKCIRPVLFKDLYIETNKILLLNKIYSLFMEVDVELSRAFLYEKVSYIAQYDPKLHKKDDE